MAISYDSGDQDYALMFPGQGSQFPGMGQDLVQKSNSARELFERADQILGYPLSRTMAGHSGDEINRTVFTQPATFVHSMALWTVLSETVSLNPRIAAGHSVGEYCALVVSGMLGFEEALKIIQVRAEGMDQAQPHGTCGMAAIIGLDEEHVLSLVGKHRENDVLEAANFNAPDQTVISGHVQALDRLMNEVKELKRTRAVMLPVSSAFHTKLMEPARQRLQEAMKKVTLGVSGFRVVSNVSGLPYPQSGEEAKNLILDQVVKPVRWTACVQTMRGEGTTFLELGPGKVLTGLLRRIDKTAKAVSINDLASIRSLVEASQ
jgi:[acyl-carrier-protein] S-malonyltransferase